MGGIKLTREEKAMGLKEIGGPAQPFMPWHDPETGQEFARLPSDAPNAANYMLRGFRMGPAPKELKERWAAGAAERAAEADRRLKKAKASVEHKQMKQKLGAEPEQQPQTDLVRQTVEQVLKALGHKVPDRPAQAEVTPTQPEETEAGAPKGPVQLKLL
jgi:hypothetical protein